MTATALRIALVLLLAVAGAAQAQVYRYTDENGVVHYTDKPPTRDAKPVQLPELLTYKPGASAPAASAGGTSAPPAAKPMPPAPRFAVNIVSPTPGETLREATDELTVAVSVMPGLAAGFGLIYYLDGMAFNPEPLTQTSLSIAGVFRGEHTVEVALVDSAGKELARSPPVTVFMKQPTAPQQQRATPVK